MNHLSSLLSDQSSNENERLLGIVTAVAVENATDSLVRAGFPASDVSVSLPESLGGPKDIGTEKATEAPEHDMAGGRGHTVGVIALGVLAGVSLLAIPDWALHRSRPNHSRARRPRCGWRVWWIHGSLDRPGNSGVRSEAT